ncbi:MAG: phosphoglycerate kinase [Gammaproteobacteria bacterium]
MQRSNKLEIYNKNVLLRLDLNVPVFEGKILSNFRISKCVPMIMNLLSNNNKVIILSHFGRPKEGSHDESFSLNIIVNTLEQLIGEKVTFCKDWIDGVEFNGNNIVLCENVRFQEGEKTNSPILSKKISALGDVYIFDAFGVSHRKTASTYGVSEYLETFAGDLLRDEIINAKKLLSSQKRPMTTIISGAKISTKLTLIKKLISKSDNIILGGGILNTFLKAMGHEVGDSLIEDSFIGEAEEILNSNDSDKILMPIDVMVSSSSDLDNPEIREISMVQSNDKILDIGKKTIDCYNKVITESSTIFWNGPLGYVEKSPFDNGTIKISKAIASSQAYSVVGGGDTIPIIESLKLQNKFSCLSTGGGSLLKFIEGEKLPVLEMLGMYEL